MIRVSAKIGVAALLLQFAIPAADAGQATEPKASVAASCAFSAADQAWIDRSLAARRDLASEIGSAALSPPATIILFDVACVRQSANALSAQSASWISRPHKGQIQLPNGRAILADVISLASESGSHAFYVMSTPSLWRAKGVPGGPMGLESLMTAVLLHESAHVAQFSTYMRQIGELAERNGLPESFNDDSIQERFRSNVAFSESVRLETELLYAAALSNSDKDARRLARKALDMMEARRQRWFSGPDEYLAKAEDLFLGLEGSGQWVGFHWLTSKNGAGMTPTEAIAAFGQRSGWWTQDEGLALVLATERVGGAEWRKHAFGDGSVAGAAMLDRALKLYSEKSVRL